MIGVNKHLRISREANEKIQNRDKDRFPLERDFINAAILSFEEKITSQEILEEIRGLRSYMEEEFKYIGWQ